MKTIVTSLALLAFAGPCLADNRTDVSLKWNDSSTQEAEIRSESGNLFKKLAHHGPAIENEWMGMRIYFDKKCTLDPYNKQRAGLELAETGWYPTEEQQQAGWGSDQYKVGPTIGLGGIRLWDNGEVVRLDPVSMRTARVREKDGYSQMEMLSEGVPYKGGTVDVLIRVTAYSGIREMKVEAFAVCDEPVEFVTGINYWDTTGILQGDHFVGTWGVHPEDVAATPQSIGAAVFYNPDVIAQMVKTDGEILLVSKPAKELSTWILSACEKEAGMNRQRFEQLCRELLQQHADLFSDEERLAWWHEARFGMFIHWGVYSQYAGIYNGHDQVKGGAEWIMNRCKIPVAEYKESARTFNPENYDPEAWVKMARDAGMKYLIITAKHHDGFSLFDSEVSDWDVVDATPHGRDLLKPLAEACEKQGIKLGFYYSQNQDWCHPGGAAARRLSKEGWPNPEAKQVDAYTKKHNGHWDPVQETATFDDYIDRIAVPQVREILSNYGEIAVLWWDTPRGMTDAAALKFPEELKRQPHIITNDRLKRPNFPGDTKTPEQHIPDAHGLEGVNWEVCMTMNESWGYGLRKMDAEWKTSETLIRNLVDIVSKGGNYLLNVGPQPDGAFPEESIVRLKEISDWMSVNSEAIHGTKAGPYQPFSWGRCAKNENEEETTLYFFVFDWPVEGALKVPGIDNDVMKATLLADNTELKAYKKDGNLMIELPADAPDKIASVLSMTVKGTVENRYDKPEDNKIDSGALDTRP